MRPLRESKIITSHLEGFVDLRSHLEVLLYEINNILATGESWLQGNEEFGTFSKINYFLGFELASCLNKLRDIAGNNEVSAHESHSDETEFQEAKKTILGDPARKLTTEYLVCDKGAQNVKESLQGIIDKMSTLEQIVETNKENYSSFNTKHEKLSKLSDKMSTKIKTLQEKLELQDENFETKYNSRFNEIMAELQTASDFIQAKTESFSETIKETEHKLNAEINVRCKNFQSELDEAVIEKLKGYNTELQTQTENNADIKQEKDCFTSKITEMENKLLCITKTVENMSISHENVPHSNEKLAVYDESFFSKGCHETLMSEGGEAGLHEHFISCTKNPGHEGFIPVENFTLKQMPEGLCNKDLYQFVKEAAALTVRVDVKMTSPCRQVSDPFYDIRGSTKLRTGSGRVTFVREEMYDLFYGVCECKKCLKSGTRSKQSCEFHVYTAAQVVYDDLEARHTSIRLFYDSETSPVVSVDDVQIVDINVASDLCKLKCITCNKQVAGNLSGLYTSCFKSLNSIKKTYEDSRDIHKVSFIVSHPHGCSKQISFGRWVNRYQLGLYNKFTYTTCTCPGSSGAAVYCLGFEEGGWNVQLVHSGSLNPKLNYSGAGGNV